MGDLSKHFSRHEFACPCGCGFDTVDAELLDVLERARAAFARPIIITSGARCHSHNLVVGGQLDSQHLVGKAADIAVKGMGASLVANHFIDWFPGRYGIGRYDGWTHIDVRHGRARW